MCAQLEHLPQIDKQALVGFHQHQISFVIEMLTLQPGLEFAHMLFQKGDQLPRIPLNSQDLTVLYGFNVIAFERLALHKGGCSLPWASWRKVTQKRKSVTTFFKIHKGALTLSPLIPMEREAM